MRVCAAAAATLLTQGGPAVATTVAEAEELLAAGQWQEAVDAYRGVLAEEGRGFEPLYGLARALHRGGELEEAGEAAREAAAAAATDSQRARALALAGRALVGQGKKKLYPEAVDVLRGAVEADPELALARLQLAEALILDRRKEEARPLLEALAAADPESAVGVRAAGLLRHPENVEYPSLPVFRFVTLDGREVRSAELAGQIVLLDFWATWCPPCVESIPSLARFHEQAEGKPLRLISISADEDAETLRRFVAEKEMDWDIVHDGRGTLRRFFGVRALPTYLLVDGDGFIVGAARGYSSSFGDPVDRLIRQARSMAKKLTRR